ncbi:START domain-containing protein [Heracleum sosnowskyi]|uniref:START domain-containing protein n=1 Tax=Heracleum sosnowskyi TaxID=360622 RepID=A0AAD8I0K5_9APIA|nr:START domain-containing protein [Heracleum sosnowskyi]
MEEEKLKWEVTSPENTIAGGWLIYTSGVILIILISRLINTLRKLYFSNSQIAPAQPPSRLNSSVKSSSQSQLGSSCIISDADLKTLIDNLDGRLNDGTEKWENVIEKSSSLLSYSAKCCKPKDGPLKYMSVTVFEDCSAQLLKDFYMDNSYREQWDNTVIEQNLLQVGEGNGVEIGRLIKKFPLLTAREYVLAWRLWETGEDTYYCISKECEHPLAPRQKKYVRVRFLRSGWMIRKVPGRNACEIRMMHQEDAGLNPDMAKLAFAKGIWRYISKMNDALRKYSAINNLQMRSAVNENDFVQKVPSVVGTVDSLNALAHRELSAERSDSPQASQPNNRRSSRRPSNKLITNSLILLGGVICLSRGRPNLGAKVAMSYILTKLAKRGPLSQKACFSTTVS